MQAVGGNTFKLRLPGGALRHAHHGVVRHRSLYQPKDGLSAPQGDREVAVAVADDAQAGHVALPLGAQRQCQCGVEIRGLGNLRQGVPREPQRVFVPVRIARARQPQRVVSGRAIIPGRVGIALELPVEGQRVAGEVVVLHDAGALPAAFGIRQLPPRHRLADAVAVLLHADEGPVVLPAHGLKVEDAAHRSHILEVDEEAPTVLQLHPAALVRAVHRRAALVQHDPRFIRAVDAPAAQNQLPAGGHAARRREDVVPAVALVQLRPLHRRGGERAIEHQRRLPDHVAGHRVNLHDAQPVLDAAAAVGVGEGYVGPAVVVPQRAGIDPAANRLYTAQGRPLARRVLRRGDEYALIRHWDKGIEPAVVIAQAGRPGAAAVDRPVIALKRKPPDAIADQLPVYQVRGMQHGHAGHIGEAGGDHVKIAAHANHVRIAVVGAEDRVCVFISHCRPPYVHKMTSLGYLGNGMEFRQLGICLSQGKGNREKGIGKAVATQKRSLPGSSARGGCARQLCLWQS